MKIYSLIGELVDTIIDKQLPLGEHQVTWKAQGLSGGIYIVRLETGRSVLCKKMTYLK